MSTVAPDSSSSTTTTLTWASLVVAAIGTAGSLHLSLGMGLSACPLCFYQRSFIMAVLAVLLLGLLSGADKVVSLAGLALPLAVAATAVALWHVYLEFAGKLECPNGILGIGTAPQQSLAALGPLTILLLLAAFPSLQPGSGPVAGVAGIVLGCALAFGCLKSVPPAPQPDYDKPFLMCRPPKPATP